MNNTVSGLTGNRQQWFERADLLARLLTSHLPLPTDFRTLFAQAVIRCPCCNEVIQHTRQALILGEVGGEVRLVHNRHKSDPDVKILAKSPQAIKPDDLVSLAVAFAPLEEEVAV